jgi:hypothetical protein
MSRFGISGDRLALSRHRVLGITVVALLVTALAACATGSGSPALVVPTNSPTSAAETPAPSPSSSPSAAPASADPTSLHWVQGALPGVPASTDPDLGQEFHVLGWSKGYLGFTSTFVKATGSEQSVVVTSSTEGLTWRSAGRLDLGDDRRPITVSQLVEGPAGLLATAEQVGCSLHKPAVRMWRSSDGASWTPVDLKGIFGADVLPSVSAGSAGYVVLAATSKRRTLWTSQDGAAWHKVAMPSAAFGPQSVASSPVGVVVVGRTPPGPLDCGATTGGPVIHYTDLAWSSQHGLPWTQIRLPDALNGPDTAMSVDRLNDGTVLIEEVATAPNSQANALIRRAWTSSDGLTWGRNDALAIPLGVGDLLTDGTRTVFIRWTDQDMAEIWALTHDLRVVNLSAGTAPPIATLDANFALGPTGLVVTDSSGANSWLGVPVP